MAENFFLFTDCQVCVYVCVGSSSGFDDDAGGSNAFATAAAIIKTCACVCVKERQTERVRALSESSEQLSKNDHFDNGVSIQ